VLSSVTKGSHMLARPTNMTVGIILPLIV